MDYSGAVRGKLAFLSFFIESQIHLQHMLRKPVQVQRNQFIYHLKQILH